MDRSDSSDPRAAAGAYTERLTAPAGYWAAVGIAGLMVGLVFLRASVPAAIIGWAAGTALCGALVVSYGRTEVAVRNGHLDAGPARLPLSALGAATPLDAEAARRLRTTEADMRAFMLLRSYIDTAVRVEVVDPADPTPYLYLSSRRPKKLAKALTAAADAATATAGTPDAAGAADTADTAV